MNENEKSLHESVTANHHNVYLLTQRLQEAIPEIVQNGDMKTLADMAYAVSECEKMLDDSRKSCSRMKELLAKLIGAQWITLPEPVRIETEYCYVHPNVKPMVQIPNRNTKPELFERWMEAFNVPENLWKFRNEAGEIDMETTELVRLHYPGIVDWIQKQLQDGKPLPSGVEDGAEKYNIYTLRIHPRKGVQE